MLSIVIQYIIIYYHHKPFFHNHHGKIKEHSFINMVILSWQYHGTTINHGKIKEYSFTHHESTASDYGFHMVKNDLVLKTGGTMGI